MKLRYQCFRVSEKGQILTSLKKTGGNSAITPSIWVLAPVSLLILQSGRVGH